MEEPTGTFLVLRVCGFRRDERHPDFLPHCTGYLMSMSEYFDCMLAKKVGVLLHDFVSVGSLDFDVCGGTQGFAGVSWSLAPQLRTHA